MKIFLRLFFLVFLVQVALEAGAQCNDIPSVSNATHSNITATTARLGGNITDEGTGNCHVLETGVEWSATSGGPYTTVVGSETGAGPFTVDVTGLPAGTRIYYRGYGTNEATSNNTDYTSENNFYTLALEPAAHASSLTATAVDNNEILLQFPAAGSIANADGYIVLMKSGSAAGTTNLDDGSAPTGASDFRHILTSTSATDYTVTGLSANTTYHFAIVPYNREGVDNTYNYLVSPGYPVASATTEADVDVNSITGNLAPTGTPLNSSSTDQALVGFALNASGSMTFQSVVLHLSSTVSGKLTNWRLCESADATFNDVTTDAPLAGVTFTPTATSLTITLSTSLLATPTRNFFLVADVEPGVTASTPSVQLSYDETDFTFNPNNLSGTGSQSRTYTFADVTPPLLVSTIPSDNATGVDFNLNKLTLNFNENVDNITTAADDPTEQVIIFNAATNVAVLTVARGSVIANGTTLVEVTIPPGTLQPNSDYYVRIGNVVLEDVPADNDWPGISNNTTWNFSTSGVV
ncbi:MAG: Ig-like domain-containing protein, partial [Bacteroidota bacterium]|nr:Ig-like domain-containing protein [Bacteroidota bacterium]